MSWQINQINARNIFSLVTGTSPPRTIPPGDQTIWDRSTNPNDGPTGSIRPNIFPNPIRTAQFPMRITGRAPFPDSWRGGTYTLAMFMGSDLVLQSGRNSVPASPSQIVNVVGMYLMFPNLTTRSVDIPFRWAGDFKLILRHDTGGDVMTADRTTRLELCWARSQWPNGPLNPPGNVKSRVNMTPGYPIILWRMFVPTPTEFRQIPPAQYIMWYIRRAVGIIWNPTRRAPLYDTEDGRASYVAGALGGSFNLVAWANIVYQKCNCYDMAGIAQLACSLLMDAQGTEIADSRWVFQQPNGFINPGPLIGWIRFGGDNLRCNTPFWKKAGTPPWVLPGASNRTSFGNHAWIEVLQNRLVVDATHALQAPAPFPPAANQTRVQYLNATLDSQRPRGTATTRNRQGVGHCWQNPETQQYRIGVSDPWGRPSSVNARAMLPEPLGSEVSAIVERGKSAVIPDPAFSAVSLSAASLCSALDAQLEAATTVVSVFPGSVHLIITFTRENTTIVATIYIHDTYEAPIDNLLCYLSGFQVRPLESVIQTCEPHLGAYSFHTSDTAFWVRGNLFIRLEQFSDLEESLDFAVAAKLDTYLSENPVLGVPNDLELERDTLPGVVKRGETFKVALKGDPQAWAKEKSAVSSDEDVVVTAGAPDEENIFELYAIGPGTATVTMVAAQKESLRPVQATFEVVVEDADVNDPYAGIETEEDLEPVVWIGEGEGERVEE